MMKRNRVAYALAALLLASVPADAVRIGTASSPVQVVYSTGTQSNAGTTINVIEGFSTCQFTLKANTLANDGDFVEISTAGNLPGAGNADNRVLRLRSGSTAGADMAIQSITTASGLKWGLKATLVRNAHNSQTVFAFGYVQNSTGAASGSLPSTFDETTDVLIVMTAVDTTASVVGGAVTCGGMTAVYYRAK